MFERGSARARSLGLSLAIGMIVALAVPASAAVTALSVTPESDQAPAGVCNAFTVTLTGAAQTEITGQTVDVEVRDTDTDNPDTRAVDNETPVNFCKPSATSTNANYNEGGPNPQRAVEDENTTLNDDGSCEQGYAGFPPFAPAIPGDPPGCDGTLSGEVGATNTAGQVTFGIRSDEPGHYSVFVYYEPTAENDTHDTAEPSDTAFKEFTQPVASPQCSDSADNDADGLVDYPNDPGCTGASDNDETNQAAPASQCSDGLDNDGDTKVDFPADDGCTSAADDDETAPAVIRAASSIGIQYNHKHFKGSVSNQYKKCRIGRKVVLKRAKKGTDPTVAKGTTDSNGNYSIKRAPRKVRRKAFYAKAKPKSFTTADGTPVSCQKARSPKLVF